MVRGWREISREEKERLIEEARKLKKSGCSYNKITEIFEERYSIKVSSPMVYRELNPEKKRQFTEKWRAKSLYSQYQLIKTNRSYIVDEVKRRFEERGGEEEIVDGLSKELNLWPSLTRFLVSGLVKIIKNPGISENKILTQSEIRYLNLIGINYIREKYGQQILHKICGDVKKVYNALKEGPLTSDEIRRMIKGEWHAAGVISKIRKKYKLSIHSERIPFSVNKCVYFLSEHRDRAIAKAREEAFKICGKFFKNLQRTHFKFGEDGEEALLNILLKPFVREDDEDFLKLKNYEGVFNYIHRKRSTLKYIELDGKRYYSFWDYGLEGVKNVNELIKELFGS